MADQLTTFPANPDAVLEQMILFIQHLKDIYVRETEALEDGDSRTFLAMQEEKFAAATRYQEGIDHILARKDEMQTANPLLKSALRRMQEECSKLFERNLEALERMNGTMGRLGEKLRSAAMQEANKYRNLSYGEHGHVNKDDRKMVSTGMIETA